MSFFTNQRRDFDPASTSVARLQKRHDELKARGVRNGVVAKLSRLISKMTRHGGGAISAKWSPTEKDYVGGGVGKPRPKKAEVPFGKLKASQKARLRR